MYSRVASRRVVVTAPRSAYGCLLFSHRYRSTHRIADVGVVADAVAEILKMSLLPEFRFDADLNIATILSHSSLLPFHPSPPPSRIYLSTRALVLRILYLYGGFQNCCVFLFDFPYLFFDSPFLFRIMVFSFYSMGLYGTYCKYILLYKKVGFKVENFFPILQISQLVCYCWIRFKIFLPSNQIIGGALLNFFSIMWKNCFFFFDIFLSNSFLWDRKIFKKKNSTLSETIEYSW